MRQDSVQWKKLRSLKAIEKFQSQFGPDLKFNCRLDYGYMPNGAAGRIETYLLNGEPKMQIRTANDHSYSGVYGV